MAGRALVLPAVLVLAGCGSVPGPPACHWGSAESFYLAPDVGGCRDVIGPDAQGDMSCTAWAEPGSAPRTATSGASRLRVWLEAGQVRAQPVVPGGCFAAQTLATAAGATELAAAWTGELYEVAWSQPEGTFVVRVDETSWQARAPVRIADVSTRFSWLAALGRRVLVRQRDDASPGAVRLYDDQLREHGAVDPGPAGALVDAALGGDQLAVVWGATGAAPGGALVYDLPGGLGAPRSAQPVLGEAPMQEPHVAWTGDRFVVVWWESDAAPKVFGATLDVDGQLVAGRSSVADGMAPRLSAGAGGTLLVYAVHDSPTFCFGELRAAFVDADTLVAAAPFALGSSGRSTLSEYAAVAVGAGFEVATVAATYAPSADRVVTTCASPMFVGVGADGVAYTEVLGQPYR